MLDLGATVRQCPLASIAGDGDCYSLGYSVAHACSVGLSIMEWLEGKMNPQQVGRADHQAAWCLVHAWSGEQLALALFARRRLPANSLVPRRTCSSSVYWRQAASACPSRYFCDTHVAVLRQVARIAHY